MKTTLKVKDKGQTTHLEYLKARLNQRITHPVDQDFGPSKLLVLLKNLI